MPEIIKENSSIFVALAVGIVLAAVCLLSIWGMIAWPGISNATQTATVTINVSAEVKEWLTFGASTTNASMTPDLVNTAGATAVASSSAINLSLGTNTSQWSLTIRGTNNGLSRVGGGASISSVADSATATVSAGVDNYGANATTSYSGVTVGTYYASWGNTVVGALRTGGQVLASRNGGHSYANVATIRMYAACDAAQLAGTYTDTVTITATAGT